MSVDSSQNEVYVNGGNILLDGDEKLWLGNMQALCLDITSPITDISTGKRIVIGRMALMDESTVLAITENAKVAWKNGNGLWPKMSAENRISIIQKLVEELKKKREEIIEILMWEICKNSDDAASEFDRTMGFIEASIDAYREMNKAGSVWRMVNGIMAFIRRSAIGIMLCLGPFNYPFNETYAALIPALLMGNIVIMKVPMVGGLAHMLTLKIFAEVLPKGVMNFLTGSGRTTVGPVMRSGIVDIFSFIGSSKAADSILKEHPHPHRLKVFLQLEGKNLGIVLQDADLKVAVEQIVIGATSFNGQRCTAIKLIFIHRSLAKEFIPMLTDRISQLKAGLPWEKGVSITPLPEMDRPAFLEALISDAVSKGASVINHDAGGGELHGSLMRPAVVYPVTSDMRLWREEQFGPVVPVAIFDTMEEIYKYLSESEHGLQAAVFTRNTEDAAAVIDALSTAVGRININTQCARSPDVFPFSARKSSGLGTMSVTEALATFSIETVIASKKNDVNELIMKDLVQHSKFLEVSYSSRGP
eukprot:gene5646-11387_t